ncbi:hypothetical protein SY27_09680 [Flavobacterium sp. 316]|uniref:T9SS C-terminal target domain-containing protein n=1 Tax=Flavobacterium sediminilitoris TaxID=2024526 RepID=A0ABY4HRK3_9FLAO|nr:MULTISPECIES: hypothetical protein [Flavobacterium]KIX21036.1 hypothetical protein SY27_09680 [Flavobacterium sp. 316]UOX35240.1 hypothetical protein LXD69_06915 [Flavobacterium sediminilitoris]
MKKLLLSTLAITALLMTSCSRDDDSNETTQTFDPSNFKGVLTAGQSLTLDPAVTYKLTGSLVVKADATLTIPAGTRIEATGGTSSYIAVAQDALIYINGTETNPVIMTSGKTNPAPGDWGGLVVCGKARTNKGGANGETATAEVSDLTYGGSDNNDSSGIIRYLRIEYTGAAFTNQKEFNGLSLFGVGSGTTVEYVQAYKSGDDGIEFFGGSVNAKYLIALHSEDDAVDFADGYSGTLENVFIKDVAKAGVEGSNNGDNGDALPTTNATLKNFTILKGSLNGEEHGMYIKEGGGKWNAQNIYIQDFSKGIKIKPAAEDAPANTNVDNGFVIFNPIQFVNVAGSKSEYSGTNTTYLTEGNNTGAGNGAETPSWAQGWTTGL